MVNQLEQKLQAKVRDHRNFLSNSRINTVNLDPITYNSRYPWFDQANYRKLESKADNLWLTGYQREQFMDNLYQQVLPEVQKQIKNSDRRKYINDASYEVSQIQDKDAQIQAKSKLAVTEISQKLKEKYNIDPSTNDEQLFNDWIKSVPNGNQLFANYLNKWDTELLKKWGLWGDEVDNDSYAKIESKINWALKWDWGRLSTNWLKYVQWWKLILDATELAKAKWATWMNDWEIMRNIIKSSPKLQQKVAELQSLQNSLTEWDKSVLEGKTNWIEVGKAWFSLFPWVSLQFGDDTSMNIALVKDKPASYKEIQDLIDVKEKFGDNYVWEVGNVAKVFASQPIDTLKKKWNQTLNELDNIWTNMESFWNDIMPKQVVEAMQWRELTDEEFEQFKQSRADEYDARKSKNKEQVLKYNDKINKAFQKQVEMNLDPQIKEYYDDKTMTELLALWDMKWVWYKQAQMMASNWDMLPNIVVTAVNTPAWLTLMFGDSYARESQDSFERLMEAGADYDQASWISKVVWVINWAVEVWLDRLFWWVETTASKNLKNAFMNNLTEEATKKWFWEILGNIAKKQAGSSLEEWAEEVIQEIVGNAAEMTIKDNPEFADLFKWVWEAFEWGVFNPMNLIAWWTDIAANKWNIQQSLLDASYDAWVTTRNIVDAGSNMQNNLREFMLDWAYNAGKGARNIVEWADKVKEFMNRKKWADTNTAWVETETNTVKQDWDVTTMGSSVTETDNNWDKATWKEELYSIDPTFKKKLQNNPYTAEVRQRTKDYIEKNGRPEKSNDVAKDLIVDVADKVQTKLVEKMEEWGERWKLYQQIDNAWYTVDLTELKDWLDEMLEWYGIEIEDGKLNFDKTAIDGSEASNIRKIYNWLQNTNAPMSEKEFRTRFKQAMKDMVDFNPNNKDQAWRRRADTPWDKVIKWIMKKANDLAHAQIPELADLDKVYSEWTDFMDEVSDWLVYKDAAKKWVIKDNVYQIIKNLDEPSRRQMVERLEKLIPWIKDEVNAINQMPKVIDHYYNPSKLQKWLTSETLKTIWSVGGLPWYLMLKWGWEEISWKIDKLKSEAWDKVLSETSEGWKAKMREIQERIENNEAITQQQANFLKDISRRIEEVTQGITTEEAEKKPRKRTSKKSNGFQK